MTQQETIHSKVKKEAEAVVQLLINPQSIEATIYCKMHIRQPITNLLFYNNLQYSLHNFYLKICRF